METNLVKTVGLLIREVDLEIAQLLKNQLAPFQLAPEQNLIMLLLWEKEGMSQNEIAETVNKDKASVARMMASLEKKGYLRRVTCPHDRRSVEVYLTEKGRELHDAVLPVLRNATKQLYQGMTNEDMLELRRLLTKIRENIRQS